MSNLTPQTDSPNQRLEFSARTFLNSDRYRELDRRQSYYDCTQHDFKRFDFDGRVISSAGGISATQPLLSAEKAAFYVPLRSRRPSSPYRLSRVIVNSFTNLVFGEGRFPTFRVEGDDDTQDFIQAVVKATSLPVKMIQARNYGGSEGSVGLSWCFSKGKPRVEVHHAKYLFVHEWEDRVECLPRHVSEVYQTPRQEWDESRKKFVTNMYWYRRDWTPNMDIVFKEVKVEPGKDPIWSPNLDLSEEHNDGMIHFVWIQNRPADGIDGIPDYEGLYEACDTIDLLLSVITRGATLNLDPTLVLKMNPNLVNRMGVKKGSDNSLVVGEEGDASYLELGGESLKAGVELFNAKRRAILEVAQCVIPDPDQVTANGTSSVAMKVLYAPMIGSADILREQYAAGMVRLLEPMIAVARLASKTTFTVRDEQGNEQETKRQIVLPQKVTRSPKIDDEGEPETTEEGNPTGDEKVTRTDREPGEGGEIEPQWGPYFMATPTDQQTTFAALSQAVGAQPFMSTQTATEIAMKVFGRDATEEQTRVAAEKKQQADQQSQMFADQNGAMGGQVPGKNGMPPGGKKPFPPKPGGGGGGGAPPKPGGSFKPFAPPAGKKPPPFG